MRYWSNKRASGNSLFTIGNGKMLIYECGPNIRNIYAPYYTGPCFGALNFNDLDFVAECKSQYDLDSNLYKHEMYKTVFEGKPYAWFEDSIDSGKCIFKRAGECLDSMSFKFVLPSYVKVQKLKDCNIYKNKKTDFLVLVIPKGTGFLNEFILKEDLNLIVGLGGCAEFTEDFEEIRIGRGKFEIYIVSADEIHLIKEVSGALRKNTVNCISDEDREFFCILNEKINAVPDGIEDCERIREIYTNFALNLKMQRSVDGAVVSSSEENVAKAFETSALIRGMLAMGFDSYAKELLLFWNRKYKKNKCINEIESIGCEYAVNLKNRNIQILDILYGAFLYYEKTKDAELILYILPMLNYIARSVSKYMVQDMLPFSSNDEAFSENLLPLELQMYGSAVNTLTMGVSFELFYDFLCINGRETDGLAKFLKSKLHKIFDSFFDNFSDEGIIKCNSRNAIAHKGREQFIFGICPCHEHTASTREIEILQKVGKNDFMCPACASNEKQRIKSTWDKKQILSIDVAMNEHTLNKDLIEKFTKELEDSPYLWSISGGNKISGVDLGKILVALVKTSNKRKDKFLRKTVAATDQVGAFGRVYVNDKPNGSRNTSYCAAYNVYAIDTYIEDAKQNLTEGNGGFDAQI